ncbi:MAG: hypothetical protein CVT62_08770 [Actinobacteria bacterium HGW-Actinobacteria-2]|nr:MAG: hypothetical protein CVT62_08770 [Actinobacteria bacterium HGW-Actinobacteria-2]
MHFSSLIRKSAIVAAALAVGGTTFLGAPATAQAAPAFEITAINAATTLTVPTTRTDFPVTVTFDGPDATADLVYRSYSSTYDGPSVTHIDGLVSSPSKPSFSVTPGSVAPRTPAQYAISLSPYTDPGKYRITIPISQKNYDTSAVVDKVATYELTVIANPAVTASESRYDGYGKYSKKSKWTWSYSGPSYMSAAPVKVYYKAKGKKKYVKVASGWTSASGSVTFKGKKGAIRKKGTVYFVIGGVAYAPGFQSAVMKLVTR